MTPISAILNTGSVVAFGSGGGGNLGGEWAYRAGLVNAPHGATEGISSAGYSSQSLFGSANFNGANLAGPAAVDGDNYGITSAGDNFATGNTAVTGGTVQQPVPLIKNSVVFTLSGTGLGSEASALSISNVSFQYGSDLQYSNLTPETPVPEPATLVLLGGGLLGLALGMRRL